MTKPLVQSTGRRKEAVARVRLRNGEGKITINGREVEDFFPNPTHRMILSEPLRLTQTEEVYDVDVTMHGGGVTGQAGPCAWPSPGRSSSWTPRCAPR